MTDNTEIALLKCCEDKRHYDGFRKFVKNTMLTEEAKELLVDLEGYFKSSGVDKIDWSDFEVWYDSVRKKSVSASRYGITKGIIHKLQSHTTTPNVTAVLEHFTQMKYVQKILDLCTTIMTKNTGNIADVDKIVCEYLMESGTESQHRAKYLEMSVKDCLSELSRENGYDWPLECLNVGVGPLMEGDFIIVAGRPNSGKARS